jgi:soluble lytic murein transglycosylase-like protein
VRRWRCLAALAAALVASNGAPAAGLWGFVDGAGVAHVAQRPLDARYQLVLDDGQQRSSVPRVPGKSQAPAGLLTWMDIAPEVKVMAPWVRESSRLHGVDAELLTALIAVESGFNALSVSPRGAIGLMQITAESADRYASPAERQRPAEVRLLDARLNIDTGARMLADLLRRHPRTEIALAAWNAGEGSVQRAGGGLPEIEETRAHVHLVMELYWALLQRSQTRYATRLRIQ